MAHEVANFLIHKAGRGWYCPNAQGYTLSANEAGRFTEAEAIRYTHPNGPDGPRDGLTYKHESDVESGSNCEKDLRIHDLIKERDALRKGQEELAEMLAAANAKIETLQAQMRGAESAAEFLARHSL
jgi:hypothetical protein